ncbi:MAG: radical SAM/SPASM domain-containing protein [Candidatus Moraniibacteriota bacterium]
MNLFCRFKKDIREIELNIYLTTACDTGCKHCNSNSSLVNPIHFTEEMARIIVGESKKNNLKLAVLFTGGGEPLLNSQLASIADTFFGYKKFDSFHLFTSGFTAKEKERKENLRNLLCIKSKVKHFEIYQSFNLYHKSFPERLINLADMMMSLNDKSFFFLRACVSIENYQETHFVIEKTLGHYAFVKQGKFFLFPLGYFEKDRHNFPLSENDLLNLEDMENLKLKSFNTPHWYFIKKGDSKLIITLFSFSFLPEGRGRSLKEKPFSKIVCFPMGRVNNNSLLIGPDGAVYPDCGCYPDKVMCLGKIGENPLSEIIERKNKFSAQILKRFLSDSRVCQWGTDEVCVLCKKIVAEGGLVL